MHEMDAEDYFGNFPPLRTERLIIRQARIRDAESLLQCTGDPEVARYVLWEPHRSLAECRSHLHYLHKQYRACRPSSYVVALRDGDRAIGTIGFTSYQERTRTAEVGYSFARAYWNHGVASEALEAFLSLCFERMHLHRVEAMHDVENPASGHVMEHCGFRYEGTLRQRVWNKGQWRDVCLWAILETDYRDLMASMRR